MHGRPGKSAHDRDCSGYNALVAMHPAARAGDRTSIRACNPRGELGPLVQKPDTPSDEAVRLATLRSLNVLNTASEERFDRLTRMARRMFNVPVALVSLVDDDRQWFISCIGLEMTGTPRDISFCGHAILGDDVFVIPDATQDPRFADNPMVRGEPDIRFYAGCPLYAPNGQKLGTLCIIDHIPRTLSNEDTELLRDLAIMVEKELAAVHLATVDELTGIANRRGFRQLGEYSLNLCARENLTATLIFFDLDGFKQINDTFGHAEGDHALQTFAGLLRNAFRDSDLIARLGGDEYVVLLLRKAQGQTENVVQRLSDALDKHNRTNVMGYEIRFSHGAVNFDADKHRTIDDLLDEGDRVMYAIKRRKAEADTGDPAVIESELR